MASDSSFYASLQVWAGDFAPKNWSFCHGQLLPIQSNQALFSLIGNFYDGDGRTTFGLPNLQGRAPVCMHPDTFDYQLGNMHGSETTYLLLYNLPSHTHQAEFTPAGAGDLKASVYFPVNTDGTGGTNTPSGNYFGKSGGTDIYYNDYTQDSKMAEVQLIINDYRYEYDQVSVDQTGNSDPFSIMQPYLVMNYIICTNGIYPPRSSN